MSVGGRRGRLLSVSVFSLLAALGCADDPKPHDHSTHDHGDHDHGDHDHGSGEGGSDGDATNPLDAAEGTSYPWRVPANFPAPWEPKDNPTTAAKVELGRHLFYDVRLSENRTQSCASCHEQALAFTDGKAASVGSTGEAHPRSAMTLANVGYAASLTWANPLLLRLEDQALVPLFGERPIELGHTAPEDVEARMSEAERYTDLFAAAFPESETLGTLEQIAFALAAFQRTLISGNSAFDRWQTTGADPKFGALEEKGYELFNSEKFECFHCHSGFNFSDHVYYTGKPFYEAPFHNTGLYNLDGEGAYPEPNTGVFDVTGKALHMGRFKAPTLRNVEVTAPYMHDGSIATLEEVLDHYAAGGRTIPSGPYQGVGSASPLKDSLVVGFDATSEERDAVLAFLRSLTDEDFLADPAFSDPWTKENP